MITYSNHDLSELIEKSGQSWLLDGPHPEAALANVREKLEAVYFAYGHRYRSSRIPTGFDDRVLFDQLDDNPERVRAFLQALGESSTPDIAVMAWRIIQGETIKRVDMHYENEIEFRLNVQLEHPQTREVQEFQSNRIEDAALLRHWGILRMEGKPVFAGFDALPTE